jgi:hypothetical protein
MKRALLTVTCVLLFISLASPQNRAHSTSTSTDNWVLISLTKDKVYYYKPSQVRKTGRIRKVWLKAVPSGEEERIAFIREKEGFGTSIDFSDYAYTMALWYVDCLQEKVGVIEVKEYNQYGQVIFSAKPKRFEWYNIVPDSVGDHLSKFVCK